MIHHQRSRVVPVSILTVAMIVATIAAASALRAPRQAAAAATTAIPQALVLAPIDPQRVQDQDNMTWSDYHAIPGADWADPTLVPTRRQFKMALVAVDFDDEPFVITQPKQSELFGNPQINPVPRPRVAQFYADFFNTPSPVNHGHTINGYWMEQSRGRIGIAQLDAFGPYHMPKKLFQYGLNEYGQAGGVPTGYAADGRMEPDADALWAAAAGADIKSKYDIVLRLYAGYDETGVWQEFGEMKFPNKESIPAEWGNPDTTKPRWVASRYVPWTSWKAGQMQWGLSSVRQGENSGTITHEIAHFAFGVPDNNNNPYVTPYRRVGSGPWDVMDRGSFNGPGGPHRRWVVPPTEGAAMPAGLTLRSKILNGFLNDGSLLQLNRNGLARSGMVVATVVARAVEPAAGSLAGITVALDGDAPQDHTPPDDMNANPLSAGRPEYNFYTVEVVQRIGYDSFTPDNGVLIAKNKYGRANDGSIGGGRGRGGAGAVAPTSPGGGAAGARGAAGGAAGGSCGANYTCFTWVIDAHPEDANMIDFKRPSGETVMRTLADYRQLNDALFHAGLNSGSQFEWEDTPNRLHFYVVNIHKDDRGILSYTVAVRSLDGSGPQRRSVSIGAAPAQRLTGTTGTTGAPGICTFTVINSGATARSDSTVHPQNATQFLDEDVYRLSASVDGQGWIARMTNALVDIKFGSSQPVPVYVTQGANASPTATVSLKAVSEGDPTKTANATCRVTRS